MVKSQDDEFSSVHHLLSPCFLLIAINLNSMIKLLKQLSLLLACVGLCGQRGVTTCSTKNHKIVECFELEGTFKGPLVQPSPTVSRDIFN